MTHPKRVVLVTGCTTGGIGYETAKAFEKVHSLPHIHSILQDDNESLLAPRKNKINTMNTKTHSPLLTRSKC
jgi:NADP-dependent 3-hydroxy acid dehydrogenase YdfG